MKLQRVIPLPFLVLALAALFAGRATAQEPELEALHRKLEALKIEAHQLQEQGRLDAAQDRRAQAEKLAHHLQDLQKHEKAARQLQDLKKPEKAKQPADADPERILGGLEHGAAALRALGRKEDAEHLMEIARDFKSRHAAHSGQKDQPAQKDQSGQKDAKKGKEDGGAREREVAMAQMERLALAMKAMQEAGREDAAEALEQAIRVRKLALAGRHEEAKQAGEHAPDRAQLAELATHAANLWREWGHEGNSEQVLRLAKELGAKKDAPAAERRAKDGGGESVEQLERQISELRQALERLQAEVRKMRV